MFIGNGLVVSLDHMAKLDTPPPCLDHIMGEGTDVRVDIGGVCPRGMPRWSSRNWERVRIDRDRHLDNDWITR